MTLKHPRIFIKIIILPPPFIPDYVWLNSNILAQHNYWVWFADVICIFKDGCGQHVSLRALWSKTKVDLDSACSVMLSALILNVTIRSIIRVKSIYHHVCSLNNLIDGDNNSRFIFISFWPLRIMVMLYQKVLNKCLESDKITQVPSWKG